MQLVVEISEDTFFDLKKKQNRTEVDNAILNGTPLPKGHGKLIDSGILDKRLRYLFDHKGYSKNLIGTGLCLAMGENLDMQPIIDADKEQEDE